MDRRTFLVSALAGCAAPSALAVEPKRYLLRFYGWFKTPGRDEWNGRWVAFVYHQKESIRHQIYVPSHSHRLAERFRAQHRGYLAICEQVHNASGVIDGDTYECLITAKHRPKSESCFIKVPLGEYYAPRLYVS